jgi:hypothetical protein
MKVIRVSAKQTKRRDQRLESVLAKHLTRIEWLEEDGLTLINIEVDDETIVERLASELKACGCIVRVYTEKQYEKARISLDDMFVEARRNHGIENE